MKKVLLIAGLLLGAKETVKAQEIIATATNKSVDGFITLGYIKNGWGAYVGSRYDNKNLLNTTSGTISNQLKYGLIKTIKEDKWLVGAGIQPTNEGNKFNTFIGYNPLKSKDMKLWIIGSITGDTFSPGLGLSYKLK